MKSFYLLIALLFSGYALAGDPIRPDASKTPGETMPGVTVEQITTKGYANVLHGGVRNVPQSLKRAVFVSYFGSVPAHPGDYEIDHLISLELGGANTAKNLWPQSYGTTPWNSRAKDRLENWLAASVRHTLAAQGHGPATALLKQYQTEIAVDWIAAYKKHIAPAPPRK